MKRNMAEGGYDPNEADTFPDDNDRTPLIPRGGEEIGMRRRPQFISRPPPRTRTSTSTSGRQETSFIDTPSGVLVYEREREKEEIEKRILEKYARPNFREFLSRIGEDGRVKVRLTRKDGAWFDLDDPKMRPKLRGYLGNTIEEENQTVYRGKIAVREKEERELDINKKIEEKLEKGLSDFLIKFEWKEGKDGLPGPAGSDGKPGEKGKDGVGRQGIPGSVGKDGKQGKPGEMGKQGKPGEKGKQGKPGEMGKQGKQGEMGKQGKQGEMGKEGKPGSVEKPGERGEQGKPGVAGKDGKEGKQGERGKEGIPGVAGKEGKVGKQGIGVSIQGEQGIQGERGRQGVRGIDGKEGEAGIDGIDGIDGRPGERGDDGRPGEAIDPETLERLVNLFRQRENVDAETLEMFENLNRELEAARERVIGSRERLAVAEREEEVAIARLSTRDRIKAIFKKYGFTVFSIASAIGVVIGVVVSNLKAGLTKVAKGVGNGLKELAAKLGQILPGMIGAIASFIFKTAGEAIGFLAEHAWLLVVGLVVLAVEQFKKRSR